MRQVSRQRRLISWESLETIRREVSGEGHRPEVGFLQVTSAQNWQLKTRLPSEVRLRSFSRGDGCFHLNSFLSLSPLF